MQKRGLAIALVLLLSAATAVQAQNAGAGGAGGSGAATAGAMGVPGGVGPVQPAITDNNPRALSTTLNSNERGQATEGDGAFGCADETQPTGMSMAPHAVGAHC